MNYLVLFSTTSNRCIRPQSYHSLIYNGYLRKKEGDESIIKVDGVRKHVMVEKTSNGYWWLVDTGKL